MEPYVLNKKENHKFILIEKLNYPSKEMSLWDILKIYYGFDLIPSLRPISYVEKIKQKLGLPTKKPEVYFLMDWLSAEINDNEYKVFFDSWSVALFKNGTIIFDDSKFENGEILQLIV